MAEYKNGGFSHPEVIPGTWMPKANLQNNYEIDRVAQKTFSYTGIKTFPLQDIALIEAQWGPIAERQYEHLVGQERICLGHEEYFEGEQIKRGTFFEKFLDIGFGCRR